MFAARNMAFATISSPVISGTAYPGETLTSTQAGQWYVNGGAVSGETGSTYVIRLNDIGYDINQTGSNTLTCWSPADISAVAGFWTPYRNVYASLAPDTAATNGQTVVRWVDIINSIQLNRNGAETPTFNNAGTHPYVLLSTDMLIFSDLTVFNNKTYGEIFVSANISGISTSANPCYMAYYRTNAAQTYARLGILARSSSVNGSYARTHPLDNATAKTTTSDGSPIGSYVFNARAEWLTGGKVTISRDNGTGTNANTDATANTPNTSSNNASIGGTIGGGTSYVNGNYYSVCLVNDSLTATERSKIARYMGLFMSKDIALE